MKAPIIIMGFGRSGTTWVSDIVSKTMGGLILFEPFHPAVKSNAYDYLYASGNYQLWQDLLNYSELLLNKHCKERWLLRNHLPRDLDHTDANFESTVWQECNVIGFKEIRLNMLLPKLLKANQFKIIFTIRHPLAVIASIKKRTRFWLEFGLEKHYEKFIQETFNNELYKASSIQKKRYWLEEIKDDLSKATLMWAVTHELLKNELKKSDSNFYLLDYEKLYNDPFSETRLLLKFLGQSTNDLHPSYIFTPSMTTHKTLHGSKDMAEYQQLGKAFFWEKVLLPTELKICCNILKDFQCPIDYELPI